MKKKPSKNIENKPKIKIKKQIDLSNVHRAIGVLITHHQQLSVAIEIDRAEIILPLHPSSLGRAQNIDLHSIIAVKLVRQKKPKPHILCTIEEVVGPGDSLAAHIHKALVNARIPLSFSEKVDKEAHQFPPTVSVEDQKNRTNLCHLAFCTIDGSTAKDFDDAVFARPTDFGIEVFVGIADVSHYVKENSALDLEALERSTSVYYPGQCVPMLPEYLSNGLCSLKPKVKRLCLCLSFELGPKGSVRKVKIQEAIFQSQARLTYEQVQHFFDEKPKKNGIPKAVQDSLDHLKIASSILRLARQKRGAIDFDIVESVVALDDEGEPISIHPESRLETHKLIEDLMVASNELVAQFFAKRNVPCIYRVHEPPDPEKLEHFLSVAQRLGALKSIPSGERLEHVTPKLLQGVIEQYKGHRLKKTLDTLLLRAMMQAQYSELNKKHFGLASDAYLHFTSPIRRYADLMVHRQLRQVLFSKNKKKIIPLEKMATVAQSCSEKESKATDLERQIDSIFACFFMKGKIGDVFDGVVIACTEFGFFVRLSEFHVEGLVHISAISRRHVTFDPDRLMLVVDGTNERISIGDHVRIEVSHVNLHKRRIDFILVDKDAGSGQKSKKKPEKKSAEKRNNYRRKRT